MPTEVVRAVRGAAAARSLRGARLGLLGGIIPGYGDVVLDPATAAALGIELVEVGPDAIAQGAGGQPGRRTVRRSRGRSSSPRRRQPLLERSRRIERFLAAVVADARLDALALNCHSDVLRFGDELGAVGCLGASVLWARRACPSRAPGTPRRPSR